MGSDDFQKHKSKNMWQMQEAKAAGNHTCLT